MRPRHHLLPGRRDTSFDDSRFNSGEGRIIVGTRLKTFSLANRVKAGILLGLLTLLLVLYPGARSQAQEASFSAKVNFQSETAPVPTGYLRDFGEAYGARTGANQGSGLSYGWVKQGDLSTPVSLVGNGRDRDKDTNQLVDTLMHMQLPATTQGGVDSPGAWEIAVPNGAYTVKVAVGDAGGAVDSEHWINIENQNAISSFVPQATGAGRYATATRTVVVDDGKLTVQARSGTNTKIDYVDIASVSGAAGRPHVATPNPGNLATGVDVNTSIVNDLQLPSGGVDPNSLSSSTVQLHRVSDGAAVGAKVSTSGGADTINLDPDSPLAPSTLYRFDVTSGVKDVNGNAFLPFSFVFTTAASSGGGGGGDIAFDKVASGASGKMFTSVTKGPDGKLYAGTLDGNIYRYDIAADGTLSNEQTITTVRDHASQAGLAGAPNRTVIGLTFDPVSTANNLILWITDDYEYVGPLNVPDFSGHLAKLTGPNLGTYNDVLTNLPRSVKDHETNSIAFGPDGALYFQQGANNAMGAPDNTWGNRPEHLLTAATLRLDPAKLPANLPLDVKTVDAGGPYDPFAADAPLTVYARGIRNAYDLLWHSNGHLYVPTNGSAAGGNTPATPSPMPASCQNRPDGGYNGPSATAINNNQQSETDYVFDVKQGKYYGHPNPSRCEWILNAGNPNNFTGDPAFKVNAYPSGQQADPNYDLGGVYNAGLHASANGVIEYKGNAFGGALKGKLVVVRYSANQDLETFDVASGGALSNRTTGITGFTNFNQPLDVTEDNSTGNLYVTELGGQKITLLRPQGNTGTPNIDATPGRLIFNDVSGGAASASQKVTIKNTGSGPLNISNLSLVGDNPGQFQISNKPALPATVAAGGTATVDVTFNPTSVGVKGATLRIDSDDPDTAQTDINLRGLGTQGIGGSNEPSLQWILDTYEIPVNTGDLDPTNNTMPSTASPIGDEVLASSFTKAEFDHPVSVEPIAVFGPQGPSGNPNVANVRAHASGTPGTPLQTIFDVPNSSYQSLNPATTNAQDFDPSGNFGFDWVWPALNHTTYQEDAQNTWETDAAARHKVRVYPLKDKSGAVVQDAYIVAPEDVKAPGVDYQDVVLIVRNVKPVTATNNSKVELQNLDGVPFNDRLAFSRIQNPRTDKEPADPQLVHDTATVRVKNTGTDPLTISGLQITGPWQLVNGPSLPATVPVNGQLDLTVKFTATSAGSNGGLYNGTLNVQSDASNGPTPVELSGFWQSQSEGGQEPSVAEIVKVMGWKTNVPSNLNENGSVVAVGDEVLSPYWKRADTSKPVNVTQISAYHTWNNGATFKWVKQDQSTLSSFGINNDSAQSLLPWAPSSRTVIAGKSYTPSVTTFGFKVDGESSDDTKNNQTPDKNNGCTGACGHHVRFFPVEDRAGDKLPGQYFMVMDYSGINYDYNDNVYLISNVRPEKISAPANVNAVAGDGQVELNWDANTESDLSGYNVYRGASAQVDTSGTPLNGATPLTNPSYIDKDVANGTTYYYVVQAVDQGGGKAASESVSATPTVPSSNTDFKANFQNAAAPVPQGYFRDYGQPYGPRSSADQGSGMVYGWVEPGTHNPLDLSVGGTTPGNGRDRNLNPDQRLDTLMHMQAGSATLANPFNGTAKDGTWEVSVPDGAYKVTVAAGDASTNSDPESHTINVEGTNAIDNFVPSGSAGSDTRHKTATLNNVTVSDGRLTIDANGGQNSKIDYIDVAPADQAANQPPVVTNPGDQTNAEGDNVTLSVDASDPDQGDTLTYEATGLPGGLSIDPSTGEISGAITSGASANSPFSVTVKATDGSGASDSKSFSWTVTGAQATGCSPRSTLDCADVPVALPYSLTFDGGENGLKATGFTMVDPPSAPLTTPSNPDVPGYEPSKLDVSGGKLTITSTKGIMYLKPSGAGKTSTETNSQVNALGVGINAANKTTRIETNLTVPAFPNTANSEQGGIWFGLDEDNYAKLVVLNTGNGNAKIQLMREIDAASNGETAGDEVNTANVTKNGDAVKLTMVPDAAAGKVTAFYKVGDGQEVEIGSLPLPDKFFTGTKLNQSATQTASFAGVFDTNRRGNTPVNTSFNDFSVSSDTQAPVNQAPTVTKPADQNNVEGDDVSLQIEATDPDAGDTLSYKASGLPDGLSIDPATGLISGTVASGAASDTPYNVTVTATDDGTPAESATATFNWTVTAPQATGCAPYSQLACGKVAVGLPYDLNFDATTDLGGLGDKNGLGTGFTMVQPSSNGGAYLPNNLSRGSLIITTTNGIQYKTATTTTNGNTLDNGLGVGFDATKPIRIETTIANPPAGNNKAEQGGIWFGPDEDNYVKLVVASAGSGNNKVQLLREINGNSVSSTDEVNSNAALLSNKTVRLILIADPTTNEVTASYTVDGGTEQALGKLGNIPAKFFDGSTLSPRIDGVSGYAGIFATHRNATSPVQFAFKSFSVAENAPQDTEAPAIPTGLKATPSQNGIALDWADNTEADLAGYNVYRSDSANGTFVKLNNAPLSASEYNDTGAPVGQFSYYRVTAVDESGNESGPITDSAERPAPDTAPGAPNGLTATPSQGGISLTWDANTEGDLAGYNVYRKVDGETDFSKLNNALLTDTTYNDAEAPAGKVSYYRVTAVDAAGNESDPATDSAKRPEPPDTQAPEATITSGPEGTVNKKTATFEFSANEDGSTFECKLDDSSFESCASPKQYTGLEDGKHAFTVRATDAAGNTSAPVSRTWTVDATAPATPTNLTAKGTIDGIALDWADNGEQDLAGYNIYRREAGSTEFTKLNNGLLTNSQYNDTKAPAGTTSYYRVMAVDKAGNESNFALESAYRLVPDTTAPATPRGLTATASVGGIALDWADNSEPDLAGYNVSRRVVGETGFTKLNGALLRDSKYDDTKAPVGKTSYYRVTAVDKAGNESNFAADSAFRPKDTIAPQTSIKSGPSGYTRSRGAGFTFGSSEAGSTFECKLDSAGYGKCSSPKTYTGLRDGRHTFYVRATDAAGNTDKTPAIRSWIVDTRAPVIGRISPTGSTRDRTPTIRATVRDSGSELTRGNIRLYIDGKPKGRFSYNQRTDRMAYTQGLARGSHAVRIVAFDKAGNRFVKVWRFRVL